MTYLVSRGKEESARIGDYTSWYACTVDSDVWEFDSLSQAQAWFKELKPEIANDYWTEGRTSTLGFNGLRNQRYVAELWDDEEDECLDFYAYGYEDYLKDTKEEEEEED